MLCLGLVIFSLAMITVVVWLLGALLMQRDFEAWRRCPEYGAYCAGGYRCPGWERHKKNVSHTSP